MKHHNLFAKSKSDTTSIFSGAKKGNKNFIENILIDSYTIIIDPDDGFIIDELRI